MMTTIFIEDDVMLRKSLSQLLTKIIPDLQIVAVAGTVSEAIEKIICHQPEIILLDLNLREQCGLDVLRYFPQRTFEVVILTANSHLAEKFTVSAYNHSQNLGVSLDTSLLTTSHQMDQVLYYYC